MRRDNLPSKEQKRRILELAPHNIISIHMNHKELRDFQYRGKDESIMHSAIHRANRLGVHAVNITVDEDDWGNIIGQFIRLDYMAQLVVPGQELPRFAIKETQMLRVSDLAEFHMEYPYREDWYTPS